jgi:hypothetical protein
VITPRQELILRKVVAAYNESGQPVGSKTLAADAELEVGALEANGIARQDILILNATGLHRPNEGAEMEEMVGAEIAKNYRIENHHGKALDEHVFLGTSARGVPMWIDRRYVEADLKITTGLIEPHLMAGYSGGRKVICPGIAALVYAGYFYAADSWHIAEHSNVTADGPPVYHFKSVIPIAGALIMLQGVAEIVRCVACLQTGEWPSRLKDVAEIDVIEEQLAHSEYVDEESRKIATERLKFSLTYQKKRGIVSEEAKDLPEGAAERIRDIAKRVYRTLKLSGFARIDLRLSESGRVYVIEANPNPQLSRDEDFAQSARKAGLDYGELIQRIVNLGIRWQPAQLG